MGWSDWWGLLFVSPTSSTQLITRITNYTAVINQDPSTYQALTSQHAICLFILQSTFIWFPSPVSFAIVGLILTSGTLSLFSYQLRFMHILLWDHQSIFCYLPKFKRIPICLLVSSKSHFLPWLTGVQFSLPATTSQLWLRWKILRGERITWCHWQFQSEDSATKGTNYHHFLV